MSGIGDRLTSILGTEAQTFFEPNWVARDRVGDLESCGLRPVWSWPARTPWPAEQVGTLRVTDFPSPGCHHFSSSLPCELKSSRIFSAGIAKLTFSSLALVVIMPRT